jgi:hypothetical protein
MGRLEDQDPSGLVSRIILVHLLAKVKDIIASSGTVKVTDIPQPKGKGRSQRIGADIILESQIIKISC